MATTVKFRRGDTAKSALFTGAQGEITVDTDKNIVLVHDGATAGGHPLVNETRFDSRFDTRLGTQFNGLFDTRLGSQFDGKFDTRLQTRLARDSVNVLDYGAVGDGITNDAPAFAAALATGKPVLVPQTTAFYKLSSQISLPAGAVIQGLGLPTLKYAGTATNSGVLITAGTGVYLRDLIIDGGKTNTPVTPFNNANVLVQHDDFTSVNVSAINCRAFGFRVANAKNASIKGGRTTAGSGPGISLANASFSTVEDIDLTTTATHFGTWVGEGTNRCLFKNLRCINDIASGTLELIGITYQSWGNRVEGCHAEGTGDNGISVTGYSNVITGNTCRGNYHAGIWVYGRNNTVTGNVCWNNNQRFPVDGLSYANIQITPAFGGEGRDNVIVGNTCYDDQAVPTAETGVKVGGHSYNPWTVSRSFSSGNRYCYNGTSVYAALSLVGTVTGGTTAPTHTTGTVSDGVIDWTFLFTGTPNLGSKENVVMGNMGRGHRVTDSLTDTSTNNNLTLGKDALRLPVSGTTVGPSLRVGNVFPTGAVTGTIGDLFLRSGGGRGITAYLKESGNNDMTGWTPVMTRQTGSTASRPTLSGVQGYLYYDTTVDRLCVLNNANSFTELQQRQATTTALRPTPAATEIGRMHFDTSLNKPIWWNGTGWRDATGTAV